ncbi:hypothetical protein ETU08_11270 [Apibacter muscae]|nr:hypothetical protein ETU08_11270 [Apibacter muscae]
MYAYSSEISSSCLKCSYERDILLSSFYVSFLFIPLIIFHKKINKWYHRLVIVIVFILLVLLNNYKIFADRVSSWSSYSFLDELLSIWSISYPYLTIGSLLVFFFNEII